MGKPPHVALGAIFEFGQDFGGFERNDPAFERGETDGNSEPRIFQSVHQYGIPRVGEGNLAASDVEGDGPSLVHLNRFLDVKGIGHLQKRQVEHLAGHVLPQKPCDFELEGLADPEFALGYLKLELHVGRRLDILCRKGDALFGTCLARALARDDDGQHVDAFAFGGDLVVENKRDFFSGRTAPVDDRRHGRHARRNPEKLNVGILNGELIDGGLRGFVKVGHDDRKLERHSGINLGSLSLELHTLGYGLGHRNRCKRSQRQGGGHKTDFQKSVYVHFTFGWTQNHHYQSFSTVGMPPPSRCDRDLRRS